MPVIGGGSTPRRRTTGSGRCLTDSTTPVAPVEGFCRCMSPALRVTGSRCCAGASSSSLDTLLALSRDDVPQVRAAAARSLATSPDPRAKGRRTELAADPDPAVRAAATAN